MPSYKLTWTIDAEGPDALDAVRRTATDYFLAEIAQGREGSACVFEATDQEGQTQTIDLSQHQIHLECCHADTCLPSFWGGHQMAHIQVAVHNGMTFNALKADLRRELNQGAIMGADYPGEHNDQWYYGAIAAVNAMTVNEGHADPEHLFKDLEIGDDEKDDDGESVYAFFVFTPIEGPAADDDEGQDDEPDQELLDNQTPV